MKLKILYAVLLLGAISQLNGSYYWNRINYAHQYRSQCAKTLCYGNNNLWNNCMTTRYKFNILESKLDKYYERDCYAIGGIPNIYTDKGFLIRQCNPSKSKYFSKSNDKYFNISVCGLWDLQDRKLLRNVQFDDYYK
jgi:hypothetical protein